MIIYGHALNLSAELTLIDYISKNTQSSIEGIYDRKGDDWGCLIKMPRGACLTKESLLLKILNSKISRKRTTK